MATTIGASTAINTLYSELAIWIQENNTPVFPLAGFVWRPSGIYQGLAYDINQFPFPNARIAAESINVVPRTYEFDGIPNNQLIPLPAQPAFIFGLCQLLKNHTEKGGLFTIFTIFGMQKSCVLLNLDDISQEVSPESQVGAMVSLKFFQPIITQNDINTIESLTPSTASISAGGRGVPTPPTAIPPLFQSIRNI